MEHEARLAATLVRLADTLSSDYDPAEYLRSLCADCAGLVDASMAGVLVASNGTLGIVAASSHDAHSLEMLEREADEGPCVEAYRACVQVPVTDLDAEQERWPTFAKAALTMGIRAVHAFPLRVHGQCVGALGVFREEVGDLSTADAVAVQALADMAAIGLVHARLLGETTALAEQLQHALDSRVVIEQAKGLVAGQFGVAAEEAFELIRAYARSHSRRVHEVAHTLLDATIPVDDLHSPP